MADYKTMYLGLTRSVSDAIHLLINAQLEAEAIYIKAGNTNLSFLENKLEEDET